MSKYKNRKTLLFQHISNLKDRDATDMSQDELRIMRVLVMAGYLVYDEGIDGMRLHATELGEGVLARE